MTLPTTAPMTSGSPSRNNSSNTAGTAVAGMWVSMAPQVFGSQSDLVGVGPGLFGGEAGHRKANESCVVCVVLIPPERDAATP